jgi:capsular polysaccharide biosynthesis protein
VRVFFERDALIPPVPVFVAELPGGRIFGSGNVLSPDGRSIARDVSEDFGKAFEEHWLLTYPRMRAPVPLAGRTAVIATTLGVSYSHWLLEELPRLLSLDCGGLDAVIANARQPFARAAFGLHGFTGKIIDARREKHWACEQLVVPGLLSKPGYPTPEALRLIEEFTAPFGKRSASRGERLYISRARARRRRVAREEELWSSLESRGFRRLFLEEMAWVDQIDAFRNAQEVVSAHGAGLANIAFCRTGTRVIELFHCGYVNPCFWRLASVKRLDYRPLVDNSDQQLRQDLPNNRCDIDVAPSAVLRALLN